MDGAVAAWRRWFSPPVRDAIIAVVVTVILLFGATARHPRARPPDPVPGGHAPPQPGAALILVGVACLALLWRRRGPVAVLGVSVRRGELYSLLGLVNGAVLVAPMAWPCIRWPAQVSLRRALA